MGWGYYLFVLLQSPPCREHLSPSLRPGDALLSSILPEVLFWSTHWNVKLKRTAKKEMYRGWWKYNWTFFSVYMMTVNDFIKSQNSIQCLTDFEEIIVIFGVRWNEPFEMWKGAVWKYWTVWTKNTIKLCTLNDEGKSSQLRAKMTHYKTWLVQFFVSFL